MTQLQAARKGQITSEMQHVAEQEKIDVEVLRQKIASGRAVIPANKNHRGLVPIGIGEGLRTKVNANIGTSTEYPKLEQNLEKLAVCLEAGADTVMDLSTGGDVSAMRRAVLSRSPIAVGTVPLYQATVEAKEKRGSLIAMTADDLFRVIEEQAADGVDYLTVHCGVTRESIRRLQQQGRVTDIVSRGGSFMTGWMIHHQQENPLYEQYDRLLDIALEYDVTLSLGDGLRPGCLADANDRAQVQELIILGELVQRAWDRGVQAMVEGPGHVSWDEITAHIKMQKQLCKGAPYYVLGPLVTDVAPGYDHITSAIGGTAAAAAGADFLCYVTPAEHLGLPDAQDVRDGIMACRIAAHAGDIAKNAAGARDWDRQMAQARKALDWEKQISLAIDPVKARSYRAQKNSSGEKACTMCGEFCAMKVVGEYLGNSCGSC